MICAGAAGKGEAARLAGVPLARAAGLHDISQVEERELPADEGTGYLAYLRLYLAGADLLDADREIDAASAEMIALIRRGRGRPGQRHEGSRDWHRRQERHPLPRPREAETHRLSLLNELLGLCLQSAFSEMRKVTRMHLARYRTRTREGMIPGKFYSSSLSHSNLLRVLPGLRLVQ